MKISNCLLVSILFCLTSATLKTQTRDYPITPVPFSVVDIQDDFWSKKIRTNHDVTIPIAFQQSRKTGRIDNFKIAGGLMEGQFCSVYPFDDSDVFKMLEAASYSIQTFPDPEMEKSIDSLISLIISAQEEDGYLYTNRTIGKNVHPWAGEKRWQFVHELSHELYNMGHMMEAAVAHYSATGKHSLLDVAIKSADLIYSEFGEGKIQDYPGHQEIEIGLVKLYRVTKDERYLELAKFFLDVRGREGVGNPKKYDQSHIPVTAQTTAVGHAVRGAYMWTAMADIAAITGDQSYMNAIDHIWHDVVDKKYYINGGIGATGSGEAFGNDYELPNMSAYCETCAGVGNALWNHRMFLMTGESKYMDVLERTMYNNILDGVSLSGDHFFYPNPLSSYGQHERSEWFGCACCPPNVARFLPSMPGYIYATENDNAYINLYISSETELEVNGESLSIRQESEFPWDGGVVIHLNSTGNGSVNVKLRMPGYTQNRPVPGDLYHYLNAQNKGVVIRLNGEKFDHTVDAEGYVNIKRKWTKNDRIEIDFPMEIRLTAAHANVEENKEKFAVERGPILYCAEWPDNRDEKVLSLIVDPNSRFYAEKSEILGGIYQIKGEAMRASANLDGSIDIQKTQELTLIPYHLWNNRGPGEMTVWLASSLESTRPEPAPTIVRKSRIIASTGHSKSLIALSDQVLPKHSNDHSVSYMHWWPEIGSQEWVQFDFENKSEVSQVKVYWFDDGPSGGCRIPAAWFVEVRDGEEWKRVETLADYEVTKDAMDTIRFKPEQTDALRVMIDLPAEHSSGLYEVIIE